MVSNVNILKNTIQTDIDLTSCQFLEPSAGSGSFIDSVKNIFNNNNILSFDIDPQHSDIKQADFLQIDLSKYSNLITIGNPPFGNRSDLAIKFFNKAAEHSSVIAFIVPVQFCKYGVQSKLNPNFKLISNTPLQENAFICNGKDFKARCCFQIWTKYNNNFEDLRIKERPSTKHDDFLMYQYNRTLQTENYFEKDWDLCIPRQGYYDYSKLYSFDERKLLNKKIQYIFFKIINERARNIIQKEIDFVALSKKNTTIPGFGKADVILAYEEKLNKVVI